MAISEGAPQLPPSWKLRLLQPTLGLRFSALGKNFSSQKQIPPSWVVLCVLPPSLAGAPVTGDLSPPVSLEAAFFDGWPGLLAVAAGASSQAHMDTLLQFQKFCVQVVASLRLNVLCSKPGWKGLKTDHFLFYCISLVLCPGSLLCFLCGEQLAWPPALPAAALH